MAIMQLNLGLFADVAMNDLYSLFWCSVRDSTIVITEIMC